MKLSRHLIGATVAVVLAASQLSGEPPKLDNPKLDKPKPDKPRPAYVVVFDFQSPGLENSGEQLARSIYDKLARQKRPGVEMIDPMTAQEASRKYGVNVDAAPARVASVLSGELAANVGVVGQLSRNGQDYTARVKLIDLRSGSDDWLWDRTFAASGERARGLLADQITQAVSGEPVAKPLEVGYDPEPAKLGALVSANGGFEQGKAPLPAAWQPIDNLTAFWVDDPAGNRGKILRINTDVYESQWKAWAEKLAAGASPADAPKAVPTAGPKYDTVAGTYGIHVYNDPVTPRPAMRYRVLADFKGKTDDFFFPKIFVKGYVKYASKDEQQKEQYREVWRTYLALRNFDDTWKHYSQTLQPPPGIEQLRLIIYAYWPPGVYEFDNVRLVEEPAAATQPAGR